MLDYFIDLFKFPFIACLIFIILCMIIDSPLVFKKEPKEKIPTPPMYKGDFSEEFLKK